MQGPFQFDDNTDEFRAIERLSAELLAMCYTAAGKTPDISKAPPGVPQLPADSVQQRTAVSLAVQAIANAAAGLSLHGFNVVDGFAHGFAATLAQKDPAMRRSGLALMQGQIAGYVQRTAAVFGPDAPTGRA